jgi:hypothetical protein
MPRVQYSNKDLGEIGSTLVDILLNEEERPLSQASGKLNTYHQNIEILYEYVGEVREGVNRLVDELSVSKKAKRFICGSLDNVELNLDLPGDNETVAFKDEDGRIHINLNVPKMFHLEYFISHPLGGKEEDMSPSLFKGLVYYHTAHELGHAVHQALSRSYLHAPRAWYDKNLFHGYPLAMTPEKRSDLSDANYMFRYISHERFAQFFGWEVLRGFGLSSDIRIDYIRTNALHIFGNGLTFSQLNYVIDGYEKRLKGLNKIDPSLSQEKRQILDNWWWSFVQAFLIYSVSLYNTYPRATVEMLIQKGWRGKQRELQVK